MAERRALVMMRFDPPPESEAEWNKWYDTTYVAARASLPGFLLARRFSAVHTEELDWFKAVITWPKYLTMFDLASANVITSKPYVELLEKEKTLHSTGPGARIPALPGFSNTVYEQINPEQGEYQAPPSKILFVLGHDVPPGKDEEFNAWYDTDHLPAMFRVPGFLTGRRFIATKREHWSGQPGPKYLTVYDLESVNVFKTPEFMVERTSPWTRWVHSWYSRPIRALYGRMP